MTGREDRKSVKRKRRETEKGEDVRPVHPHLIPDALLSSPVPSSLLPPKLRSPYSPSLVLPPALISFPSILSRMKGASSLSSMYRVSLSSTCTSPSFPAFATPPPSPCPSFLLSLPSLFYTPWSSRRIHSRDTPFFFFFFSSSFFPLPFHFIPFFSARTQTYRTTSRFTSLGDMSFSTLVEPGSLSLSPSHQPPPRHGASLKMERRGWLRLCRRRTRRDGWLRDGQSIFFFFFLFFFFISFLFFFWKSLLSLIENCFSSENRSLRGALF